MDGRLPNEQSALADREQVRGKDDHPDGRRAIQKDRQHIRWRDDAWIDRQIKETDYPPDGRTASQKQRLQIRWTDDHRDGRTVPAPQGQTASQMGGPPPSWTDIHRDGRTAPLGRWTDRHPVGQTAVKEDGQQTRWSDDHSGGRTANQTDGQPARTADGQTASQTAGARDKSSIHFTTAGAEGYDCVAIMAVTDVGQHAPDGPLGRCIVCTQPAIVQTS